jgi:hypothetical protein
MTNFFLYSKLKIAHEKLPSTSQGCANRIDGRTLIAENRFTAFPFPLNN